MAFLYMGVIPGRSCLTAKVGHHFMHSWHLLHPSISKSWVDLRNPVMRGLNLLSGAVALALLSAILFSSSVGQEGQGRSYYVDAWRPRQGEAEEPQSKQSVNQGKVGRVYGVGEGIAHQESVAAHPLSVESSDGDEEDSADEEGIVGGGVIPHELEEEPPYPRRW